MSAPLEGIRVVEIASFVAAPSARGAPGRPGRRGDQGRGPRGRDLPPHHARTWTATSPTSTAARPSRWTTAASARSRSTSTRPEARDALRRVIDARGRGAHEPPARPAAHATGSIPRRCARSSPRSIHATLNGYGMRGDEADAPAFDYTAYWARTGMMDMMRAPDAIARLPAARRRRSRRRHVARRRNPGRTARARPHGRWPGDRGVAAADRPLHPGQRHVERARHGREPADARPRARRAIRSGTRTRPQTRAG